MSATDMQSFTKVILEAQNASASYMLMVLMGTIFALGIYITLPRQHRWRARVAGLAVFFVLLGVSSRPEWKYVPALLVIGLLIITWASYLKKAKIRLPHWLTITVLAVLLRLPGINDPLWYDETFTAALARLPMGRMAVVNVFDVHPPLWYTIEWLNVRIFGSSEVALRLPAMLFGVTSCVLVYNLARRFVRPRAALAAGLLMAALPAQIYYSHEARGYALLVCVVLLMLQAAMDRRSFNFVLLSYIVPMVHSLGLVYVGLIGAWALLSRRLKWQTVVIGAGAALPALGLALLQSHDVADGFWLDAFLSPSALIEPLYRMTLYHIKADYILLGLAVVVGVTALSLYNNRKRWRRAEHALLLVMLFGVPGVLAAVSFAWRNIYLDRAMLPAFAMLPIIWAMLLNRTNKGERFATRWILLPMVFIAAMVPEQIRDGGRDLARACQNTDIAFTSSISAAFVTAYYVRPPILWTKAGDMNQELPPEAIEALGWERADFEDLPTGSICVIDGQTPLSRPDERAYMAAIRARADHIVTIDTYIYGFVKAYIFAGRS